MPETEGPQSRPPSSRHSGRGNNVRRGERGGRRGGRAHGDGSAAPMNNNVAPHDQPNLMTLPSEDQSQAPSAASRPENHRGRGRRSRGPRPPGRVAPVRDASRPLAHRAFGGHLTSEVSSGDSTTPHLSGDAPEFVPGQPVVSRSRPSRPRATEQPQVRLPKSVAADLGTRIHEDISNWNYECTICTDDVSRTSHIWSCNVCWTVVHLKCARRWHDNQKKQTDLQPSEPQSEFSWRCPGCNSKLLDAPGSYHCWCGKEFNPSPASTAVPPHSCGQTCAKPRPTCPHPCALQCHAGPCPPCGLVGPDQSCFCGKNSARKLCRETDYENGWSCQEVCEDLLPCGEHFCDKLCHAGLCGDCETKIEATCYCGHVEKQVPCRERQEPHQSFNLADNVWFEGSFTCDRACQRLFDCGTHKCSKTCHAKDEHSPHCPFAPDIVSHCPCGKTALDDLLDRPRDSCEDAIPRCDKPCEKRLPCGHKCIAKCHTGDCDSCNETIEIPCRCGRVTTKSLCHQGDLEHPLCMRTCQANLSCGRHKCGEHCCSGEKRATERQAARRKNRPAADVNSIEPEHICIRTCGRQLKCGSHECQQICHRGPCRSCPEALFHEISCDCGRTVLQPPQPCGTRPPECRFNCQRRPACGHPPVDHNCHPDDVTCPKCPYLVEKRCACGKEKLHSQPCHLQAAHCGKLCGQKLQCGLHSCRKLCHRPGECDDVGLPAKRCDQVCGKPKLFCDHPCQNMCHGQTPCVESTSCTAKAIVSCPCGVRQQEVKCFASSSNPTPARPEIKCDDECLRLERNRRLAAALNIDPTSHTNDHVPYSDTTLRMFKENPAWAETQEREFRVFAKSSNEIRMRYKPMSSTCRQFLHALAEDYGLESKSEDIEPHRYVVVYKSSRFVSAPSKTLAQCVKIRDAQAAEAAAAPAAPRPPSPPPALVSDPLNGFLLTAPRFGLTIEEVNAALGDELASLPSIKFAVSFLPTDEVLVRAAAQYSAFLSPAGQPRTRRHAAAGASSSACARRRWNLNRERPGTPWAATSNAK
ncbi:hypothetical protein HIM_06998 [Hirsutella minnesotensis 3608]|uniref:R3H domain-containing protein n=1 Tax=Hirsutella minnesotensis 3608 TaxID=1043627 RepID=A0A0F7ZNF6_9HYPO|nr:hypothetical protein HIM_06998 [Hirsutella minnesotensis 3608]